MCRMIRAALCDGASVKSGPLSMIYRIPGSLVTGRPSNCGRTEGIDVDRFAAQTCAAAEDPGTDDLARAAWFFRGPLLTDLDLTANGEFYWWLLSLREDARKLQSQILRALAKRLSATPHEAL